MSDISSIYSLAHEHTDEEIDNVFKNLPWCHTLIFAFGKGQITRQEWLVKCKEQKGKQDEQTSLR